MSILTKIRRNTFLKKRAQKIERWLKSKLLGALVKSNHGAAVVSVQDMKDVEQILIIRPNYRIGNALICTPVIEFFHSQYPGAAIDFVGTDTTKAIYANFPIRTLYCMSRAFIYRPWALLAMIRQARKARYDLIVDATAGSVTSLLFTRLAKGRYTIGDCVRGQQVYDVTAPMKTQHVYDMAVPFAALYAKEARRRPSLILSDEERQHAQQAISDSFPSREVEQIVGLFVGGHLDKRSPIEYWESVTVALADKGIPFAIFVGPEESQYADRLEAFVGVNGVVIRPRPLREFAGLMSKMSCLITPDSGPMHLAAAFDVPVIAVLRTSLSNKFVPQGEQDISLVHPQVDEVMVAVETALAHSVQTEK